MPITLIDVEQTYVLTTLSVLNFLWLGAGFFYFALRTRAVFAGGAKHIRARDSRLASTAAGDEWHFDLFIYLGAMNAALAVSVLTWLFSPLDIAVTRMCLFTWGCAHGSQMVVNWFRTGPSGRWRWGGGLGLGFIAYVDTLMWLLDWGALLWF